MASWHENWVHPKDSVIAITGAVWNWYGYRTSGHKTGLSRAAWDILEQGIQKTKQRACELASQIHPIVCGVANESEVLKAMRKTEAIGKPHLLANNAGPVAIGKDSRFIAPTTAAFGMIHYVTTAFPETKPVKGSSIVNIASIVGPVFGGGSSWYSTAKAGIVGHTKELVGRL